jgi:hypothetical protein
MARDLDNFPTYDPLVKDEVYLSNVWADFMATFIESLREYLTQNGIFVPRITTAQRDLLINVVNGQLIYNTSTNKFQGYENGAWVNLV